MAGHRIDMAEVRRPDLRWPLPDRMADRLTGQIVLRLRRRSKYILADLSSDETLIIHLGMSGRMLISGKMPGDFHHPHAAPEKHDHVVLHMSSDARVTFNDARRFGAMDLCQTDALDEHWLLKDLGPEPLSNAFHDETLITRLNGRQMPIKSALLDQRIVAGLGNIYVCEALFRAQISPRRKAGNVGAKRLRALVPIVRSVLTDAIEAGGSSLRDYRQTHGELGYFQHSFQVYDREGEPCLRPGCGGTVSRITQSGRSTYFCGKCQR